MFSAVLAQLCISAFCNAQSAFHPDDFSSRYPDNYILITGANLSAHFHSKLLDFNILSTVQATKGSRKSVNRD